MKLSIVLALLSGLLAASPVLGARGRPWRLDDAQQRDLVETEDLNDLSARWALDAFDDLDVSSRGLTDLLHSKKPITIKCTHCAFGEDKQVIAFAQKKYNKDKNMNKGHWTNMDLKVEGGRRITIYATLYSIENGKKTSGGTVLWMVDDMKEVH